MIDIIKLAQIPTKQKIVVSLTTIPSRIKDLIPTLESLNNQSIKPDAIYLTIPKKCRRLNKPYPEISDDIISLCTPIYIDNDYGPLTKLVGALIAESDPKTLILTADDDIIYPNTLIETLFQYHKKYPSAAIGSSGITIGYFPFLFSIAFNQKKNDHWFTLHPKTHGSNVDIIYGYAGALYQRKFFPTKMSMEKEFLRYVLVDNDLFRNDDVFISLYLNKRDIPRKIFKAPDVTNKSGDDALSLNVIDFFSSLNRAVDKCDMMGWFFERQTPHFMETIGSLILITVICVIILILIFWLIARTRICNITNKPRNT